MALKGVVPVDQQTDQDGPVMQKECVLCGNIQPTGPEKCNGIWMGGTCTSDTFTFVDSDAKKVGS